MEHITEGNGEIFLTRGLHEQKLDRHYLEMLYKGFSCFKQGVVLHGLEDPFQFYVSMKKGEKT